MILNNRLKVFRALRNITQGELATEVGVSRKTINTIEKGKFIPTTVTSLKIAAFFEVAVEELFWLTPGVSMDEKKQIKRSYKDAVKPHGVCRIKNLVSGKMFLFPSVNTEASLRRVRFELKMGSYRNKDLQQDYRKLGADAFTFDIPWELEKPQDCDDPEASLQALFQEVTAKIDRNELYS